MADTGVVSQRIDTPQAKAILPRDTVAAGNTADSNTFYIVLKEYPNKILAEKSFNKLTSYGNKLVLTVNDSSHVKVRMPFKLPLADTLKVKDSLARFFGGKPFVELP